MGSKSVEFPYDWKFQERDRLGEFAETELRVGFSMGSKSMDFSYVWWFQERDRLGEFAEK
eukprot:7493430-Karenia_brevis.AAC.1